MKLRTLLLISLFGAAAAPGTAGAADPRYPDWPCVQAKVPEISLAAIWDGPAIDDAVTTWQNDPAVANLVTRLAARRVPIEEAEKNIAEFIGAAGSGKTAKAVAVFAGAFDTLNRQRTEVLDGLERMERREKDLASRIKEDFAALRALQDDAHPDDAKMAELNTRIEWSTRIFDDRRKTVRYACEVPAVIERRLGAIARAIRQEMD